MKMLINEFAKLTGVTVRTLHYYDEIDLLKPSFVDEENGYRFYNEQNLLRMEEILFYRELDFSLKDIKAVISSPDYDKNSVLEKQKQLLILKKLRLEKLILNIEKAIKGEKIDMKVFDNTEFEIQRKAYLEEAEKRWGCTSAYKQSKQKTADYDNEKWTELNKESENIISEFAKCKTDGVNCSSEEAKKLVKKWQDFITANYYNCTNEILNSLAEMYVSDERFKVNIDKHGLATAEFMCDSIKAYCKA